MLRLVMHNFCLALLLFLSCQATLSYADDAFVNRKDVQEFIQKMVKQHNFDKQQLVTIFSAVKLRPQVIRHINKPLEKEPWRLYQMLFVNEWRITHGVEFWNKYADALQQAEKVFGVPASIIVATIGIETRYGQKVGEYRVIDSLSNLAFSDSPRAGFFRKELEQYLLLTREENLDPMKIMGSYAGAIGQPQFMPSSYRHYAVNFSGTGRTDLMNDEVDVIGSIANYYRKHGWATNEPVAVQAVVMGDRYNYLMRDSRPNQPYKLSELAKFGIVPKIQVQHDNLKVKVIELDNRYSKEYWLGFRNFDVIKRYNQSDLYAMAVYQLSYYIKTLRNRLNKE
ncbi:Membrane-bound lytic murein transglycosylase B [Aquicella siphonis]|uniref:Membrane-bound lytic murein transglycosylase B n=1 Tax=Aquicella siphonis TaxID=254247 RepID=A0A5E4PIE4_9COXI|nr:lytic murein transglycosylase B [Aquicella siphonis]VVC76218.1 Membrane-bound lytic murein transglycosylase B [Aquicella siphonis]